MIIDTNNNGINIVNTKIDTIVHRATVSSDNAFECEYGYPETRNQENSNSSFAVSFTIPHYLELGKNSFFPSNSSSTESTKDACNIPQSLLFHPFPQGESSSISTSWLATLRYHCDDIMAKTDTHIQIQSSSGIFNITIFGTMHNVFLAKSLLIKHGIYQAKQRIAVPLEIVPLLSSNDIPIPIEQQSGGSFEERKQSEYGTSIKRRINELVNHYGMTVTWIYGDKDQRKSDHLVSSLWYITLNGSLIHIHKAREAILVYFDELMMYQKISISVDPMLATIASGPFRSYYESLQINQSEKSKDNGYVKIYMPNPIQIDSFSFNSTHFYSNGHVSEDGDKSNVIENDRKGKTRQVDQGRKQISKEEHSDNLILVGYSKAALDQVKKGIEQYMQTKKQQTILSRSITISVQKLEVLLYHYYDQIQHLCVEYGAYMHITMDDRLQNQGIKQKDNQDIFPTEAILKIFVDNHQYRMDEIIRRIEELICKYFSIELLVHPTNTMSINAATNTGATISTLMSPIQPHCNVVKLKSFQKDIQQLRNISQDCDVDIHYHQSTGRIFLFGTSLKLMHAIDKYTSLQYPKSSNPYYPQSNHILSAQVVMEQPNGVREFVCGKKDGKLNKIMRSTGSSIKIYSWHDWSICISIYSQSVPDMIESLVMVEGELPAELSFHVPEVHHKRIIGHGGKNIQKIMKTFGVYVKFLSDEDVRMKYVGDMKQQLKSWPNVLVKTPAKNAPALLQMRHAIMELSGEKEDFTITQDTVKLPIVYHYNWFLNHYRSKDKISESISHKIDRNLDIFWPPSEWNSSDIILKGTRSSIENTKIALRSLIPISEAWIVCSNSRIENTMIKIVMDELKKFNVIFLEYSPNNYKIFLRIITAKQSQNNTTEHVHHILQDWCNVNNYNLYHTSFQDIKDHDLDFTNTRSMHFSSFNTLHGNERKGSLPIISKVPHVTMNRSRSMTLEGEEMFHHFNSVLISSNVTKVHDSFQDSPLNNGRISLSPTLGSFDHVPRSKRSVSPTGAIGERFSIWNGNDNITKTESIPIQNIDPLEGLEVSINYDNISSIIYLVDIRRTAQKT